MTIPASNPCLKVCRFPRVIINQEAVQLRVDRFGGKHLNLPQLRDNFFGFVPLRSHSDPPFS
jgi:hypothetical protein